MNKNKRFILSQSKGFASIIIISAIVAILAIGGIAYYLGSRSSSGTSNSIYNPATTVTQPSTNSPVPDVTTPASSTTTISTANWKTYINTGCDYSFQYPDSWSQSGNESNAIDRNGVVLSRIVDFIDTASQGVELSDGNNNQIAAAKDHMHVDCYTMGTVNYNDELSRYNNSSDVFVQNKKTINVAGQTAIVGDQKNTATISQGAHPGHTIIPDHRVYAFFLHKDHTRSLYFEFDTPLNGNDAVEVANFEKLLSTFKFVSVNSTTISTALPTPYISAQNNWPPVIQNSSIAYTCTLGVVGMGGRTVTTQKIINGRTYCITYTDEGAAGTIYKTYRYTTSLGSGTKTTNDFTLSSPSGNGCDGHGTPEENQCYSAISNFYSNLDAIIDSLM